MYPPYRYVTGLFKDPMNAFVPSQFISEIRGSYLPLLPLLVCPVLLAPFKQVYELGVFVVVPVLPVLLPGYVCV